jgi:hypothetical protein
LSGGVFRLCENKKRAYQDNECNGTSGVDFYCGT